MKEKSMVNNVNKDDFQYAIEYNEEIFISEWNKEILQERLNNVNESISKYQLFKSLALSDYEFKYISKEDYEEYNLEYSNKIKKFLKI